MEDGRKDLGMTGMAFLAGAAIGAAAGILLAPQSGRKTRRLIQEKADEVAEKVDEFKDVAESKLSKIAHH
ncbi:MAG: YtxH domain-containing protein [Dehalococcoidales bacterium]|nr:YtxH domain-containing protein [Dehalococcoidales bacterium]